MSVLVVHSCTSNSFSGLEGYVLDLVSWQNQNGYPVLLYCREGSELERKARERAVPLWTIGSKDRPGPKLWAKMFGEWRRRGQSSGHVTLHMHAGGEPWYHLPWLSALRRVGRLEKAILHYHIWINHRKNDPLHRALFAGVDEVWTSSETARAHLATLLPVARERIRVVPYGRDVRALRQMPKDEWRAETRAQLGLKDQDLLGVCISRLEPIKGVGELFEAFTKVAPRIPRANLILIGDASPQNNEAALFAEDLRAKYRELKPDIQRRLRMPGYVGGDECAKILVAGDFYVLPSYEECMSLAMLDAAILGLPILGTNSGGTPSVARPDETGLLVPPGNAVALEKALESFYSDPELCRKLGEGASVLGASFNQEEIFNKIWDWYTARPPTTI